MEVTCQIRKQGDEWKVRLAARWGPGGKGSGTGKMCAAMLTTGVADRLELAILRAVLRLVAMFHEPLGDQAFTGGLTSIWTAVLDEVLDLDERREKIEKTP